MNRHINHKIKKGYELLHRRKPSHEIVPEPSSSSLGKRSNPNTEETIIRAEEVISKKFHSNPSSPDQNEPIFSPSEVLLQENHNDGAIEEEHQEHEETAESTPKFIEEVHETHEVPPPSLASTQLQQDNNIPQIEEIKPVEPNISNIGTQIIDEEDDISYKEDEIQYEKAPSKQENQYEETLAKEEFLEKVSALGPYKSRFGKPIFKAHELLTLPSQWEDEDPAGWYFSKKRGGVRCMWNGFEMRTENGSLINLPEFFMEALPKSPLDGELCMEKVTFTIEEYKVIQCLGSEDEDYERIWNEMIFVVYDAPGISGVFEQRLQKLKEYFEDPEVACELFYVRLEDYKKCRGTIHAESELENILTEGGKGIRLADPLGEYVKGKTKNVLEETQSRK